MVFALGVAAAVLAAPTASAVPECTNTGPSTTQCERPGNAQINTSPNPATADNYPWGWPWWGSTGLTIGIGGIGW
jgi:hypothetical protein